MGNVRESIKISPEQLARLRKEEKQMAWEEKKDKRYAKEFWGESTLMDSYLRVAGSLLKVFLFLYPVTLVSMLFLLIINWLYPLSIPYVMLPVFLSVGYVAWRFMKWVHF